MRVCDSGKTETLYRGGERHFFASFFAKRDGRARVTAHHLGIVRCWRGREGTCRHVSKKSGALSPCRTNFLVGTPVI